LGGAACQAGVAILVRTVTGPSPDGGVDGPVSNDAGARDGGIRDASADAPGAGTCAPPPPNVLDWWPGEGNANADAGGVTGGVEGGVSFAAGKVGQAFSLSGINGGGVNLGNVPAFDFDATSSFTIEAWINIAGLRDPALQDTQFIVALNYECASTLQALSIQNSTGKAYFALRDAADTLVSVSSPAPLSLNVFHHVVGVRNASSGNRTLALYVDGVAVASAPDPTTASLARNTADLIGRRFPCGDTGTFNGLIDEVTVYGRALTAAEVQRLFVAGSAGKCR
jgi:hypothetical protein